MKKRLLFFLAIGLCLSVLTGCTPLDSKESESDPINLFPDMDIADFSQFLDDENLVHGVFHVFSP